MWRPWEAADWINNANKERVHQEQKKIYFYEATDSFIVRSKPGVWIN